MSIVDELKLLRKCRPGIAKKAGYCDYCNYTWQEGEAVFIMNDPFCMICITCGTNLQALKEKQAKLNSGMIGNHTTSASSFLRPSTDFQDDILKQILEELKKISEHLNIISSPKVIDSSVTGVKK